MSSTVPRSINSLILGIKIRNPYTVWCIYKPVTIGVMTLALSYGNTGRHGRPYSTAMVKEPKSCTILNGFLLNPDDKNIDT